jgi:putative ABC transport system permease protein
MKIWKIAARNISRNRRRSFLSGFAIAVAAMTFLMLSALIAGFSADIAYNVQTYYSGEVRLRNREYDKNEKLLPMHLDIPDYERVIAAVENTPGVRDISPRITFPMAIYREETNFRASGIGIDIEREKSYMDLKTIVTLGSLPNPDKKEILIGEGLAEKMKVSPGDKITVLSKTKSRGSNAFTFTITGLVRTPVQGLNNTVILVPLNQVQRFLKMDGGITEILLKLDPGSDSVAAADELNSVLSQAGFRDITATPWKHIKSSYSFVQLADSAYQFLSLFLFLLGSTVIVNTTMMVIYERVREIGTISALGMYSSEVVSLFFLEALFISILGSLAGIGIGIGITIPMSIHGLNLSDVFKDISLEMSPVLYPVLKLSDIFIVFAYSVGIASAASIFPSLRASRVEPVEALRSI